MILVYPKIDLDVRLPVNARCAAEGQCNQDCVTIPDLPMATTGADTEKSEGAADPSTDAAKSVAVGVAAGTAVTGATAVGK